VCVIPGTTSPLWRRSSVGWPWWVARRVLLTMPLGDKLALAVRGSRSWDRQQRLVFSCCDVLRAYSDAIGVEASLWSVVNDAIDAALPLQSCTTAACRRQKFNKLFIAFGWRKLLKMNCLHRSFRPQCIAHWATYDVHVDKLRSSMIYRPPSMDSVHKQRHTLGFILHFYYPIHFRCIG